MEDTKIKGSKRILINITSANTLGIHDVDEACSVVREAADSDDLQITFGITNDDTLGDAVKVTVIATGFRMETPMLDALREAKQPFMDQIPAIPAPVAAAAIVIPEPPPIPEPEPVEEIPIVPMTLEPCASCTNTSLCSAVV